MFDYFYTFVFLGIVAFIIAVLLIAAIFSIENKVTKIYKLLIQYLESHHGEDSVNH